MKLFRKLEVKIRYMIWSYKRLDYPTTGDEINYQGSIGYCVHGIDQPFWRITLSDHKVHENKFLVIRSFKRDWRVFWERYNFQMDYWYMIDCNGPMFTNIKYDEAKPIKRKQRPSTKFT